MKYFLVLALVVACKADKPAADRPASRQVADKPLAGTADGEPPKVEMKTSAKGLCKKIELATISAAVGVELSRTGGGILVKGGKESPSLSCSYYEKGKLDGGTSFGFMVKAATELEKSDTLGRFKWEPFDGLGEPAMIGRAKDGVHIQTLANSALIIADVGKDGAPASETEPKAVAAMKALLAQLPADAAADFR